MQNRPSNWDQQQRENTAELTSLIARNVLPLVLATLVFVYLFRLRYEYAIATAFCLYQWWWQMIEKKEPNSLMIEGHRYADNLACFPIYLCIALTIYSISRNFYNPVTQGVSPHGFIAIGVVLANSVVISVFRSCGCVIGFAFLLVATIAAFQFYTAANR